MISHWEEGEVGGGRSGWGVGGVGGEWEEMDTLFLKEV